MFLKRNWYRQGSVTHNVGSVAGASAGVMVVPKISERSLQPTAFGRGISLGGTTWSWRDTPCEDDYLTFKVSGIRPHE